MEKDKLRKSIEKAYDNLPEWIDTEEDMMKAHECLKTLKEEIGEEKAQKAFETICKSKYDRNEDDLIAKSAELMFHDSSDILDFDDDSHIVTDQQRTLHETIQSQLKKEESKEDK